MKIIFKAVALSTVALTLAVSAMLAAPTSAKAMHHSKRTMRHHRVSGTSRMHRSSMHKGSMKGRMNGGAMRTPSGTANPATSTAPATSGGDKM